MILANVFLGLLIIQTTFNFFYIRSRYQNSEKITDRNIKTMHENLQSSREERGTWKERALKAEGIVELLANTSPSEAFLITVDGPKRLPVGWEKYFEAAWGSR